MVGPSRWACGVPRPAGSGAAACAARGAGGGQRACRGLAQGNFRRARVGLGGSGQRGGQRPDLPVQKRLPQLQTVRHAPLVGLEQDVPDQPTI